MPWPHLFYLGVVQRSRIAAMLFFIFNHHLCFDRSNIVAIFLKNVKKAHARKQIRAWHPFLPLAANTEHATGHPFLPLTVNIEHATDLKSYYFFNIFLNSTTVWNINNANNPNIV
ncbi:MAG: hypothetical protein HZA50_13380 [Planctomycetes bacterium]|nr:hypothetical protein [Planctomycetota bacterium]